MLKAIYAISVFAALFIAARYYLSKWKNNDEAVDYSFGLQSAKDTKKHLLKGNFIEAEKIIRNANSDDRTQIMDYICLNLNTVLFEKWLDESSDKDIPHLALGIHFNHLAWMSRSHELAKHVSQEQYDGFSELQEESFKHLSVIQSDSPIMEEVHSRLIRHYMGNGNLEKVHEHFDIVRELNPNMVYPYIRYTEAIQPKWGGNLNLVSDFIKELPDNFLIQSIVELKLIADSLLFDTNYFGGSKEDLIYQANNKMDQVDNELSKHKPPSIHRYVLYGYMMGLSEQLGNKRLEIKYLSLMDGYYSLYPFGIIK